MWTVGWSNAELFVCGRGTSPLSPPDISNMPPSIPPRTYGAFAPTAEAGGDTSKAASSTPGRSEALQSEPYKPGKPELTYIELQVAQNATARRRIQKDSALTPKSEVVYSSLKHDAGQADTAGEALYAKVDTTAKRPRQATPAPVESDNGEAPPLMPSRGAFHPEAARAMTAARERLSTAIGDMVRDFATSIPKRSLLSKDKSTYGAGAAVAALVRDLVGDKIAVLAEGLAGASRGGRQDSIDATDKFVGRSVSAMTAQAIAGLSTSQRKTLASHLKDGSALRQAFEAAEPDLSSGAAMHARECFLEALSGKSA